MSKRVSRRARAVRIVTSDTIRGQRYAGYARLPGNVIVREQGSVDGPTIGPSGLPCHAIRVQTEELRYPVKGMCIVASLASLPGERQHKAKRDRKRRLQRAVDALACVLVPVRVDGTGHELPDNFEYAVKGLRASELLPCAAWTIFRTLPARVGFASTLARTEPSYGRQECDLDELTSAGGNWRAYLASRKCPVVGPSKAARGKQLVEIDAQAAQQRIDVAAALAWIGLPDQDDGAGI